MSYPPLSFPDITPGIDTFELGKWHPELGAYIDWENEQLRQFVKGGYAIFEIERCDTPTGGLLLLVKGHKVKS